MLSPEVKSFSGILLLGIVCVTCFSFAYAQPDSCPPNRCRNGRCIDQVRIMECKCQPGEACNVQTEGAKQWKPDDDESDKDWKQRTDDDQWKSDDDESDKDWKQRTVNYCVPNPCVHGNCTRGPTGYNCTCSVGWKGLNCSIRNYCDPNPCVNGVCSNGQNGYNCSCSTGWTDTNCSTRNYCDPNPCLNGGSCLNGANGYSCVCSTGWMGTDCSTTNYCDPDPCAPNGVCSNGSGGYSCACLSGWSGTDCTVAPTDPGLPDGIF